MGFLHSCWLHLACRENTYYSLRFPTYNLPAFSTEVQFGSPVRAVIPLGNIVRVDKVHPENINLGKVRILGRPVNTVAMSSNIDKRRSAITTLDAEEVTRLEDFVSRSSFHP